jgi:hypothetical protein
MLFPYGMISYSEKLKVAVESLEVTRDSESDVLGQYSNEHMSIGHTSAVQRSTIA